MKKYRLKKIYPGSPPLGTILVKKPNGWYEREGYVDWANLPYKIEPFPEFWEEVEEKKFKILKSCPTEGDIYSIQRISDDCIFKLKDKVVAEKFVTDRKFTQIDEIYYNEHKQLSYRTNCDVDAPKTFVFGENTEHYKEVLFVTEDKVCLFKGDEFYYVDNNFDVSKGKIHNNTFTPISGFKHFSTKDVAKEWVHQNKPIYSNKNIEEILANIEIYKVFNKQ